MKSILFYLTVYSKQGIVTDPVIILSNARLLTQIYNIHNCSIQLNWETVQFVKFAETRPSQITLYFEFINKVLKLDFP